MADENNKNDKTFTQEEVDAMIKKSVDEAVKKITEPLLQQVKDLTKSNFSLEMNKSGLSLNKEQEEVLKDYADKQKVTDTTKIVDLAKNLFGSSTTPPPGKKEPSLNQKDLEDAFKEAQDPDNMRGDRY